MYKELEELSKYLKRMQKILWEERKEYYAPKGSLEEYERRQEEVHAAIVKESIRRSKASVG